MELQMSSSAQNSHEPPRVNAGFEKLERGKRCGESESEERQKG